MAEAKKTSTKTRESKATPTRTRESKVEEPQARKIEGIKNPPDRENVSTLDPENIEKAETRAEFSPDWRETQQGEEHEKARELLEHRRVKSTLVEEQTDENADVDGHAEQPEDRVDEHIGEAPAPAEFRPAP